MEKAQYTIKDAAEMMGVPTSTIRYYDKEGLLPFMERLESGYRIFTERDMETLRIIDCLKKSGLSIKEIKSFVDMVERGDDSLQERLELFRSRRKSVQKQIADMQETLSLLEFKCWYYEEALKDGTDSRVDALSIEEIPEPYRSIKKKISSLNKN